jgi:selenocysteine lyase/cysteine desulfurase
MGPLSRDVVAAGQRGLERKMQPWTISAADFFDPVENVRDRFARVVGGDADGVSILPAVSYGVAIAAANLPVTQGQRIVLLAEQFPSNVYSWHKLAADTGAEVVAAARPTDHDWTSPVLEAIDGRTAIVSVEICHWSDGGLLDIDAVAARCRNVGAALVVDGSQSIGAMPFDVAHIRPDFLITVAYKWLLAPYGAALMWCAPERRSGTPLELSWITRRNSSDFAGLVDYEQQLRDGARRYDVGQTSNFTMIPALDAALEQNLEWAADRISAHAGGLNQRIADGALELGLTVAPPERRAPHLMGIQLGGADPTAIADAMASSGVFVSVRGNSVRVSPHVYNDEGDVDRLLGALRAAL